MAVDVCLAPFLLRHWCLNRNGLVAPDWLPFQGVVTAKEQLRERIDALTKEEASEALLLLDLRQDRVAIAFRDAPVDDEPFTDEQAAAALGRADIAAGRTVTLNQASQELE